MSTGSGLFAKAHPNNPTSIDPGKSGLAGEVGDLRKDVLQALSPLAALCVEEFTAPLATAANNMMAASATPAAGVVTTLLPVAGGGTNALTKTTNDNLALTAGGPRQISFTTAGTTPANAPATATIHGKDERGYTQIEVVPLRAVAGAVTSFNFWPCQAGWKWTTWQSLSM